MVAILLLGSVFNAIFIIAAIIVSFRLIQKVEVNDKFYKSQFGHIKEDVQYMRENIVDSMQDVLTELKKVKETI